MMPVISNNPVLITFPPSLDSELARFLLKHYGINHREEPHAFLFCFFFTLWHSGTFIFPLLYSESFKLVGPRPMAEYFNPKSAPNLRLFPQDAAEKRQVDSDWTLFNETLAFATARFAYYHLLPYRELMIRPLSLGTPNFEMKTVEVAYPIYAGTLRILTLHLPSRQRHWFYHRLMAVPFRRLSRCPRLCRPRLTRCELVQRERSRCESTTSNEIEFRLRLAEVTKPSYVKRRIEHGVRRC
jgi:hypothetical protein